MKQTIVPCQLSGKIKVPPSKSVQQRAYAAALLRKGTTVLHNPGRSFDDAAALSIIQQLGAKASDEGDRIAIESEGWEGIYNSSCNAIDCGESGLSARMFTPIAAICPNKIKITGHGSLLNRPFQFFEETLPKIGVSVNSNEGKLPLEIQGPLKPKDISIYGGESSQYTTGLLMAYSALPNHQASIDVEGLQSKPYIDLTLEIIKEFGLRLPQTENYSSFRFLPENAGEKTESLEYTPEADWSNGAFWLVAAAIHGSILIEGLVLDSPQGDRAILDVLKQASCSVITKEQGISIESQKIGIFNFDATNCPDLFPPLVVLAAYGQGISSIKGVHRLHSKESDRAKTICTEFGKMGLEISIKDDVMFISGRTKLIGAEVSSCNDHRIAMALAIAATKAEGITTIDQAEAVNKSYPDFFDHLNQLKQ